MRVLEMQVSALMQMCASEKESDRRLAREELHRLLEKQAGLQACCDPEYLIRELLLELGVPEHLVGHPYVVEAVMLAIQDRSYIDNLTFRLYPQLAARFNTTVSRVERAIRNVIEITWTQGDWETLVRYFGNTVNAKKGKPTNGAFLARIANVVDLRMRKAA